MYSMQTLLTGKKVQNKLGSWSAKLNASDRWKIYSKWLGWAFALLPIFRRAKEQLDLLALFKTKKIAPCSF